MKSKCHDCGKTICVQHREKNKNELYVKYEVLLTKAMAAGAKAIDYTYIYDDATPARGVVQVALDEGRAAFAHFLRQRHPGMFNRPNLKTPPCHVVDIQDFRHAMNYAIAFRDVLAEGGISVTIVSRPIGRDA